MNVSNDALKKVGYIKTFLQALSDPNYKLLVIDEAGKKHSTFSSFLTSSIGFGTKPLRHYSYAKIGCSAILKVKKLSKNLTCTACIS